MDDLERYVEERKKRSSEFADGFEIGYEQFKIGVILRAAREKAEAKPKPTPEAKGGKRGLRRKDDPPAPPPEPKRPEQQLERDLEANLADLPKKCDWGCKKNSQSKKESWCGKPLKHTQSAFSFARSRSCCTSIVQSASRSTFTP